MKKISLSLLLLISVTLTAQVTITMEQDGGVYKVPCIVNGAKMKFIFDTGAANVCLSESMADYLLDNDYISKRWEYMDSNDADTSCNIDFKAEELFGRGAGISSPQLGIVFYFD